MMDILKRIDLVQQFANEYADGSWSIDTEKWNHHVTPELIEEIRQYIVSLQLKLMHKQAMQAKQVIFASESYDMIDRFLRNNLYDDDYESYSEALHEVAIYTAPPDTEALRKDAERYRQLRRGQKWSVVNGIGDVLRASQLDSSIDAAIAAQGEGT